MKRRGREEGRRATTLAYGNKDEGDKAVIAGETDKMEGK